MVKWWLRRRPPRGCLLNIKLLTPGLDRVAQFLRHRFCARRDAHALHS